MTACVTHGNHTLHYDSDYSSRISCFLSVPQWTPIAMLSDKLRMSTWRVAPPLLLL